MPWYMFVHTTGITIRKDMKTGTYEVFIHKRASIIKEATGVAFTVLTKG